MMIMMMHPILLFFFILSLFLCFKSLGSLLCFPFFFLFQISRIFRRSRKLFLRLSTKEFPLVSYLTVFTILFSVATAFPVLYITTTMRAIIIHIATISFGELCRADQLIGHGFRKSWRLNNWLS